MSITPVNRFADYNFPRRKFSEPRIGSSSRITSNVLLDNPVKRQSAPWLASTQLRRSYQREQFAYFVPRGTDPNGTDIWVPRDGDNPIEEPTEVCTPIMALLDLCPNPPSDLPTVPPYTAPPVVDEPFDFDRGTDWLDCMANCILAKQSCGELIRKGVVGTVGIRRPKGMTISKIGTTSPWKKHINKLGGRLGELCRIGKKGGRQILGKGIPVVTIAEGGLSWADIISCQSICSSDEDPECR